MKSLGLVGGMGPAPPLGDAAPLGPFPSFRSYVTTYIEWAIYMIQVSGGVLFVAFGAVASGGFRPSLHTYILGRLLNVGSLVQLRLSSKF